MEIVVEEDVPIPDDLQVDWAKLCFAALRSLRVGQSFTVPLAQSIVCCGQQGAIEGRGDGTRFVYRTEGDIQRVWRVS